MEGTKKEQRMERYWRPILHGQFLSLSFPLIDFVRFLLLLLIWFLKLLLCLFLSIFFFLSFLDIQSLHF